MLLPAANTREAAVVGELEILPVQTLADAVEFLRGARPIDPIRVDLRAEIGRAHV